MTEQPTVARRIEAIGEALGGAAGSALVNLAAEVKEFEPVSPPTFNLDDFVDAATGVPAREVVGEPGHYRLTPLDGADTERESSEADNNPLKMLDQLLTGSHEPEQLSVTIPIRELMQLRAAIDQAINQNGRS